MLQNQSCIQRRKYVNTGTFYLKTMEFQRMVNILQTFKEITQDFLPVVYELQKILDNYISHTYVNLGK